MTKRTNRRPGQHKDETPAEYLRRVVSNINYEPESNLDDMPCVEALLDYHDLWATYGTDFWAGIIECIADGDSSEPARAFVKKWKLRGWLADVRHAESLARQGKATLIAAEEKGGAE